MIASCLVVAVGCCDDDAGTTIAMMSLFFGEDEKPAALCRIVALNAAPTISTAHRGSQQDLAAVARNQRH